MSRSDAQSQAAPTGVLRAGLRVSVQSIAWTVTSSAAGIALGIASGSLVLVAFGLTGILDAAASATLVAHFRHAARHEPSSSRHERHALRLVNVALLVVGLSTGVESVRRLVVRVHPDAVPAGVALAAASTAVLALLAARKRQVGRALPSEALMADAVLSATGALLGLVTVAGTGLAAVFGWWWVDPLAGGAVASGALAVGLGMALRARLSRP